MLENIPMSDEVKNEWVNDPLNKILDKWLSSGPSEIRLINLEGKHVRILKGYSKAEQKELEYTKKNMSWNDLLHNITYFPANTECGSVKDKYDEADTDERISIIKDILDFYTDKAKFPDKKYYVHFIKSNDCSYLNINTHGVVELDNYLEPDGWKSKFTRDEVIDIDPRLVPFMEEVEDDE